MNYRKLLTAGSLLAVSYGLFASATSVFAADTTAKTTTEKKATPVQTTSSYNLMTKVAGSKNYTVWKTVSNGKASGKVADGINFRYNHIQSNQSIKTKKYTYWLIYVDGRRVGWVNQNYFARNQISVPKTVTLVRNNNATFNTRDAISYATDATGTVANNEAGSTDIKVSQDNIDCSTPKTYKVKYTYGTAKATVDITVRKSTFEGIGDANAVQAKAGVNNLKSWSQHYGSSINYIQPKEFIPETKKSAPLVSGNMTLSTRLFQPVLLSVKTDTNNEGNINRVGHIPEGLTVSNNWAYVSLLSHTNLMQGHIVGYDLSKLTDPFDPQNLLTMSQSKFNSYVKNIKVSPYIPIGHGQSLGSTDKYIYALVNNNTTKISKDSEELVQIRKSDMNINKIWTIKCWNGSDSSPRYFQNAVITSDYEMYGVYYNKDNDQYEYWQLTRKGDNWYPQLVGATKSTFTNSSNPVQGFTYDTKNGNFYLAFNDLIIKLSREGSILNNYTFDTGREIEGISVSNNRLYMNLAQRAELFESNPLN